MVVFVVVVIWLAGRIYRNSVLRTGTRVKLADALRS
jgi:ABC-2 type transport system permease protein